MVALLPGSDIRTLTPSGDMSTFVVTSGERGRSVSDSQGQSFTLRWTKATGVK